MKAILFENDLEKERAVAMSNSQVETDCVAKGSQFRGLARVSCFALAVSSMLMGCSKQAAKVPVPAAAPVNPISLSDVEASSYRFEMPFRIKADSGSFVEVESPGYACPTMADIDGDGDNDLIVGQFAGGNMRIYRNVAESNSLSAFADRNEWIATEGERAIVPGIS